MLVLLVVQVGTGHAEPAPRFKPPSAVAAAQARFRHGEKLFDAKRYDDAAAEFAAAYELDPEAKFLLFNLGLARRLAGACPQAIEAYRQFLDAKPPDTLAKKATAGIEKCPTPADPPIDTQQTPPAPPPPEPVAPPPTTVPQQQHSYQPSIEVVHVPWYRDRLGDVLAGSGVVVAILGGVLYVRARSDASATFSPSSVDNFLDDRRAATDERNTSVLVTSLGTALVIAGGIRYLTRSSEHVVTVATDAHGVAVVLGGWF